MAKFCTRCEKKIGFFDADHNGLCQECYDSDLKADAEKKQAEDAKKKVELIKKLRDRVNNGEKVYLYKKIFISVPFYSGKLMTDYGSLFSDELKTACSDLNLASLVEAGIDGWELMGAVPVTDGMIIENFVSEGPNSHSGLGGNVTGVYLLMRKEMVNNDEFTDEALSEYLEV